MEGGLIQSDTAEVGLTQTSLPPCPGLLFAPCGWSSNLCVQRIPEGFLKLRLESPPQPHTPVSDSVSLGWGLKIRISNKFQGSAAGLRATPSTTRLSPLPRFQTPGGRRPGWTKFFPADLSPELSQRRPPGSNMPGLARTMAFPSPRSVFSDLKPTLPYL